MRMGTFKMVNVAEAATDDEACGGITGAVSLVFFGKKNQHATTATMITVVLLIAPLNVARGII